MTHPAEVPVPPIDRSSPLPLHHQLRTTVATAIAEGRWSEGQRLPSEEELGRLFQVSRITVRQALQALEADGAVRRERGRGTFVSDAVPRSGFLQSSLGFYDEAARTGNRVTSLVVHRAEEEPPRWASDLLRLPRSSTAVGLERLRSLDGDVVMYVQSHLLAEFAPTVLGTDLSSRSLYGLLRARHGVRVEGGDRTIQAVAASDDLAPLLEVAVGAPLLFVEAASWDQDGRVVECYRAWHRSDRSTLSIQVAAERRPGTS